VPAAPRRSAYSILLVAEDPLARFGLQSLVSGEASLEVVAQLAPDAVEAAVRARRPDAIVWDLGADVRAGTFPADNESYHLKPEVLDELRAGLERFARRHWRS